MTTSTLHEGGQGRAVSPANVPPNRERRGRSGDVPTAPLARAQRRAASAPGRGAPTRITRVRRRKPGGSRARLQRCCTGPCSLNASPGAAPWLGTLGPDRLIGPGATARKALVSDAQADTRAMAKRGVAGATRRDCGAGPRSCVRSRRTSG